MPKQRTHSPVVLAEHNAAIRDIGALLSTGQILHMSVHARHALARCNSKSESGDYRRLLQEDMTDCTLCNGHVF